MTRKMTTRATIFIASLTAALAFPAVAAAHCGTTQGSYNVTCEQGVKVYRHNAPSMIPRGLSPAQAQIQSAKIRAKSERARLTAEARSQAATNRLRQRELDIKEYRARTNERNTRRRTYVYGGGYGFGGGYTIARPIRVRSKH